MLKLDLTYNNLDGEKVTKTYHFNLSKSEYISMSMEQRDDFDKWMEQIRDAKPEDLNRSQRKEVMETYKGIIMLTVGERQDDLLIKNDDIRKQFEFSGAYDQLFMDLLTTTDAIANFVLNILPKDLTSIVEKEIAKTGVTEEGKITTLPAPPPVPTT